MNKSIASVGIAVSALLGAALGAPGAVAAPTVFNPWSVTFISTATGWALGDTSCSAPGGSCLSLRKTTNGGRAWGMQMLPTTVMNAADINSSGRPPVGSLLNVRFANSQDGWIFGAVPVKSSVGFTLGAVLWSTHNGGKGWSSVAVPGLQPKNGSILDVEAGAGKAYMLVQEGDSVALKSTPVADDSWATVATPKLGLPAGGGNLSGAIVLQGTTGWVVEGNDRGTTGSARLVNGHWKAWSPPCANLGGSLAFPAARNTSDLAAVCIMGGFASPLPKAAPKGAVIGSAWLYLSTNSGTTFKVVSELGKQGFNFGQVLAYPAANTYFVSGVSSTGNAELLASFNGGHSWASAYTGSFLYLGFTNGSQGVGILGGAGSTKSTMVMTYNGGHSWAPVTF